MRTLTSICILAAALLQADAATGQAHEWGATIGGRAAALASLPDTALMSANSDWSLAVRPDGSMIAWGRNREGQLNVPVGVLFRHGAAAWRHGIGVTLDGRVLEWGTPYGKTIGVNWITPDITNAVLVAGGDDHSAAVLADGRLRLWGGRQQVVQWDGQFTDVVGIASGWYAVVILHSNGTVTVKGTVSHAGEYLTPPAGLANVVAVFAGPFSFGAIRADGSVVIWGNAPVDALLAPPPSVINAVSLGIGRYHAIAALADGTVVAWGDNTYGQLNIPQGLRARFVSAGRYYSQAVEGDPLPPVPPTQLEFIVAEGGDDTATGTMENPFASIQRGVDAATAPGSRVFILPGTYAAPVATDRVLEVVPDN